MGTGTQRTVRCRTEFYVRGPSHCELCVLLSMRSIRGVQGVMSINKNKIKKFIGISIAAIGAAFLGMNILAKKKKPSSIYENDKEQKNLFEGKKVVLIEDENDKENADGVKGHLEAIGDSEYNPSFYEKHVKRAIDVVLSFGGLVVLSPIFAAIALAIKIEDPGPVLFTQKRVGQNKRYFKLHKFRSMKMSTPHDVPTHQLENPEQYITKVGKFLRAHSLDELPQIWDIFIGNMSVIGPRPGLWNQDLLTAERDKYGANDVKPGLTGWAQINGRDELEIEEKAKFDGEYVKKMGILMDIKCFLGSLHVIGKDESVVEGGTGEMHKEGEKTGDENEVLVSSEKIKREVRTDVAVVGVSGAVGVGALVTIGKHLLGKEQCREEKKSLHTGLKVAGIVTLIGTAATVFMNKKRKVRLQDQFVNSDPVKPVNLDNDESKPQNEDDSRQPEKSQEGDNQQKIKRILITGAGSYIGVSVENWLNKMPDKYIVDTLDVKDNEWKQFDFSPYDVVYHVAGIAHIKESKENADLYYKINRDLAVDVARKAKEAGVKQFIFMSSMSVYGVNTGIITKNTKPNPTTNYGKSKIQAERKIMDLVDDTFKVAVLRPPMVYGKGCKGNFQTVITLVERLPIFPEVDNERSMIYIDNLCSFVKLCIDKNLNGVYFPQNNGYIRTSEMAKIISETLKKGNHFSRLVGATVKLITPFVGIAQKGFGSLIYLDTEDFDFSYCVVDNKESIEASI